MRKEQQQETDGTSRENRMHNIEQECHCVQIRSRVGKEESVVVKRRLKMGKTRGLETRKKHDKGKNCWAGTGRGYLRFLVSTGWISFSELTSLTPWSTPACTALISYGVTGIHCFVALTAPVLSATTKLELCLYPWIRELREPTKLVLLTLHLYAFTQATLC